MAIIEKNPSQNSFRIPVKKYIELLNQKTTPEKIDSDEHNETATSSKKTYTVKKGDTLSEIAQKHKTTVSKLKKLNHLKNDRLQIGQKLKLK
jgi:LysM repeat protein